MKTQRIKAMSLMLIIILMSNGCDKSKKNWERTKGLNTIEAYNEFASIHPQSILVDSARLRVEGLKWVKTLEDNTIEAYQKFLTEYPQGIFDDSTRKKIDKLKWDITLKENTIEAYQKFLTEYSQGIFADSARQQIEILKSIFIEIGDLFETGTFDKDGTFHPTKKIQQFNISNKGKRKLGRLKATIFLYDITGKRIGMLIEENDGLSPGWVWAFYIEVSLDVASTKISKIVED